MEETPQRTGFLKEGKALASFILLRFVGVSLVTVLALLAGIYWIVDKGLEDLRQANDVTNERISDLSQNVLAMRTSLENSLNDIKGMDLSVVERLAKIESRLDNIDPIVIIIDPEIEPGLLFDVSANVVFIGKENKATFALNESILDWPELEDAIRRTPTNEDGSTPRWIEIQPKEVRLGDFERFGFLYSQRSSRFCVVYKAISEEDVLSCLNIAYDDSGNMSEVRLASHDAFETTGISAPSEMNRKLVVGLIESYIEYPPRGESSSFSMEQVLEELKESPEL